MEKKNNLQKERVANILKTAFFYWSKTLVFQAVFSLVYFSIFLLVFLYFGDKLGIIEQYKELITKYSTDMVTYRKEAQKLASTEAYNTFFWIITAVYIFLYPLNLGLFKVYRKMDLAQTLTLADLFSGYAGSNFFRYMSYGLFWTMTYYIFMPTLIFSVAWVFLTLFTAPLMFFMDKNIFEGFSLNIKALKLYFWEIILCIMVAFFFKYIGVFSILGALFTFPFMNAMIYALYQTVFKEVE